MTEKNTQLTILKTVAEFSSDWLMWIGVDKSIKYISPAVELITGYPPQAFSDNVNLFKEIIHPDDKPLILKKFKNELQKPHPCSIEFRIIHKNGDVRWVAHRCRPVYDDNKKIIGRVSSNRNITANEMAKRDLMTMWRIFEQSAEAMAIMDDQMNILQVNNAFTEITGYSLEEIKEINTKVDSELIQQISNTTTEGKAWRGQNKAKRKDGSVYYLDTYVFPVTDENGEIINYVKISKDITAQKQSEEALRKNQERLRTLINATPDIICFKDGQGRWLEANEADLKLFQLEHVDYRGKKDSELAPYSPFYYDAFMACEESDEISWQKGDISRGIEIIPLPTGTNKVYDVIKVPLFEKDGSRKGLVVLGRDITEMKKAQDALKQSEARNRAILQAMPDILIVINDQLQFTDCYAPGQTKLLLPCDQVIGTHVYDILPENIAQRIERNFKKALREDSLQLFEYELEIDGTKNWFEARMVPKDKNAVVAIIRDITPLKEKENALRESEKKYKEISRLYRLMADNMPDLVWAKDMEGRFLFVNKAVANVLLGAKDTNEPIGKDDIYFSNRHRAQKPDRSDWFTFGELCVNSDAVVIKNKKPQRFDEYGNVRGKFLFLDVYKAPLFDENGVMIGTVGHGRVVTKEKEIEKKLIESEQRYRRIFEDSLDALFVSSVDGKILDINPAGLKMFGYSSLEEIQKIDISKDLYKDPEQRQHYLQQMHKTGSVKDYEIRIKKKDGSEIIVLESVTTVHDEQGKVAAFRGVMRDVTEKRALEQQLRQAQKMESVGTLAGGVAHDFNNLLTVINGYAELGLMRLDKQDPLHEILEAVLKAGKRAEELTSQLLAFSRKQIYKPEILNINQVISAMDKMLRRLLSEDIKIETVLQDGLPNIKADSAQLEQIFVNLVLNARDAMHAVTKPSFQKKITIETGQVVLDENYVKKHPDGLPGHYVFFAVSDNGNGMDEKTKEKIFEPFFTTKEKYKGTGLGLSMVYGIVKQNNASIYVYSEPDVGTTFKIYWPLTAEQEEKDGKILSEQIVNGNETILVVEDEKEVCRFASDSLKSLGYKVYEAENGRAALELMKKETLKPDLIITDLIMPELNGKDFINKVKKFYPQVKVIYVSGYTDNHIVHNGILEEDVNFINKPYSMKTLASTARKVLDAK